MSAGDGARRGRGDESSLHERHGQRTGRRGNRHVALSISLHGAAPRRSRSAAGFTRNRGGGRQTRSEIGAENSALCGRQIDGRANDFAGRIGTNSGRYQRLGIFWFSAASSQAARHKTRRTSEPGKAADAFSARHPRRAGRPDVVAPHLRSTRLSKPRYISSKAPIILFTCSSAPARPTPRCLPNWRAPSKRGPRIKARLQPRKSLPALPSNKPKRPAQKTS